MALDRMAGRRGYKTIFLGRPSSHPNLYASVLHAHRRRRRSMSGPSTVKFILTFSACIIANMKDHNNRISSPPHNTI